MKTNSTLTPLSMNRQVGRVTPCAPGLAGGGGGAHGVTRPTPANQFRGSKREILFRRTLTQTLGLACLSAFLLAGDPQLRAAAIPGAADYQLFARTNLVAWCLVPFDAKKRGPEERAAMLEWLGFGWFAYDYRAEHIPTFDQEMEMLKRYHVRLLAWWFPGALNDEARQILDVLKRHNLRGVQLWVSGGGDPVKDAAEQAARVEAEAQRIRPIANAAARQDCTVALYNHGAWFGEPENQIAIIERLKAGGITNVGIVYNQHHGHDHLDRFPALLAKMKPYLVALNLNGMTRNGDKVGKKILPLGQGDLDLELLRFIRDSGWRGPIGILNHTDEDAEGRLRDNLNGLDWLVAQLDGRPAGSRPQPGTWREPGAVQGTSGTAPSGQASLAPAFGKALSGGMVVEGQPGYRSRPLTIECWAKLNSQQGFNILVASDTKASAEHWELYSVVGSGTFSLFQPGRGDIFDSGANICDGKWHYLAANIEPERVRLFVDGKLVKDAPATPLTGTPLPGELAFGQLVEGGLGCDGVVDNVRISRGAREISGVPAGPLPKDANTIGLWDFGTPPALQVDKSAPLLLDEPVEDSPVSAAFGKTLRGGMTVASKAEFRLRPITVECWAKLDSTTSFNILVASDTKASAEHWELYSYAGNGALSLYQPGRGGNFSSDVNICDGKWHYLAAIIEPERVRLFVDGKLVKDAPATPLQGEPLPGELAFGQLVEGGISCDGVVDNVRISSGVRAISGVPKAPFSKDAATVGLWNFDELSKNSAPPAR